MLTLEHELESSRPVLGDKLTDALLARERREVFSLAPELRLAAWAGAMLLATAAGIVLKENFERIGPLALAVMIGLAAAACYAWTWWRRTRASLVDDYVLVLGALLLSADLAFIEAQFKLLDQHWPRHFLLIAIVHGVAAYAYRSRSVLSLSIAALAAWLGVEQRALFGEHLAMPAFECSALVLAWRAVHRKVHGPDEFLRIFEHFAANLALWGAFALWDENETRTLGCLIAVAIAAVVVWWGFRQRAFSFVIYGFVYAVIAVDVLLISRFPDIAALVILVSMIAAVVGLAELHRRFRGAGA
ncbi:MAG TPA: DUF2157 domain-containing protein [Thermoanaerobaculia bacterium]|nr:DUF2157 domain-containing protein [Thermoanaerobaculia bacterium]